MKYNFTIRIYKDLERNPYLSDLSSIVVRDIKILTKTMKFDGLCYHKSNQKKFGYSFTLSKPFNKVSGSHSSPCLSFKGDYIDIIVKDFPRFPAYYQDKYAANSFLSGYGYTNFPNDGFPIQLLYRKIEFLNILFKREY